MRLKSKSEHSITKYEVFPSIGWLSVSSLASSVYVISIMFSALLTVFSLLFTLRFNPFIRE